MEQGCVCASQPRAGLPLALLLLGVGGAASRGGQGKAPSHPEAPRSHHHGGGFEGIVAEPELPNDAPVVTVILSFIEILPVQVGLKAAGGGGLLGWIGEN